MGSITKTAGAVAAAALMQAGLTAAPSTAYAQPVTDVPCSTPLLVTAVKEANKLGSGTLRLASFCDYALTGAAEAGRGPDGLPVITGDIALIGGRSTTISRSSSAPRFRILEISAGAVLHLRQVHISGGDADGTIPGNDTGGGILNSRGNVELIRTTVSGNTADSGAGISNDSGRVFLDRSLVTENATRAGGGGGGGFYNDGSLRMSFSRVAVNTANTNGGGIYNGQGGRTETFRSTIDHNTAGAGGGAVFNAPDGRLVLTQTSITGNKAASGGGIFNGGKTSRVTLVSDDIESNIPNNCYPMNTMAGCAN